MDGFIIINKPKGITSHDVCFKLKKELHLDKIGHSGTLDPLATGVLVIAIGKATKLINYLDKQDKSYVADILFGIDTDTYDILGKVLNENHSFILNNELIDNALKELKEEKFQYPPIYSAIKVNGKKLYDYALENKEVKILPRPIKIDELYRINEYEEKRVKIKILANRGFYVRSLIHDLGIKLGTYATMNELCRVSAGQFTLDMANNLGEMYKILSIEEVFPNLDKVEVSPYMAKLIKNGIMLDERQYQKEEMFKVYHNNKLIAIYEPIGDKKYKIVVYVGD